MVAMVSAPNLSAPGLKKLRRKGGRVDCYWVADEKLVKKGYPVKTLRLTGDPSQPSDFAAMASVCRRCQAEMLQWASGIMPRSNRSARGTVAWLCDAFETDRDSPIHGLRRDTQLFYAGKLSIIKDTVGTRRIDTVTGADVRRWFKQWARFDEATNTYVNHRRGYACIQTLRRIIGYGCELRDHDALELANVLAHMQFKVPAARKLRPSYEQVVAAREAAHKAGRSSIALAIVLQFDLALRQKDVIGEWVKDKGEAREGVTDGAWRWQMGLTFAHIGADMVLRKPTSKSNGASVAVHDLNAYPDVLAEMLLISKERRIGPVIIDEKSGKPWRRSHFSRTFRKIATAAGWPKELWNMDSRAGAISEAFESQASAEDVMKSATHTQLATTMGYNRGGIVQSIRVAQARRRRRAEKGASAADKKIP
jgi:hypothetical protein